MGVGLSCMKRSDLHPQQADGAAMTRSRLAEIMEGLVMGKNKGVEAMATEKNTSTNK